MGQDWISVQEGIRTYLGTDISLLNMTNGNLLAHSGKQVRPVVTLLFARACGSGVANPDSIKYAVASELLHNATLLHDDVADESDQRRGVPTIRKIMGPSVSVLVGDFWLVCALRAIMNTETCRDSALRMFSRTLGDLAEGEMLQLQKAESGDTSFEDYLSIIYRKTASLFVTSACMGAMSVGSSPVWEKAAGDFGKYLGYAFQMRDDIFDYMPDASSVGKPVGVDLLERKITLPLLGALGNVSESQRSDIRSRVQNISEDNRLYICDFVKSNGGLEYAQSVLEDYIRRAKSALDVLPSSGDRDLLAELADFIAIREV